MNNISSWYWFGLAIILFIFEILTFTGFLLFLALSALFIGIILVFSMIGINIQLFIFSIFAIIMILVWRLYSHFYPMKAEPSKLNQRARQYIGREFLLKTPIINGYGSVSIDDTIWRVRCDKKLIVGTSIQVIDTDGVILIIEESNNS